MTKDKIAIYIHWPFCYSKCPYCDFNSYAVFESKIDQQMWRESYIDAIRSYAPLLSKRKVCSIFFGGGTPSIMDSQTVDSIIEEIAKCSQNLAQNIEISLEANPCSVTPQKLHEFSNSGVNRISLGLQSLRDNSLQFLGRTHNVKQALTAIKHAKKLFKNISFDLMYALPEQTISEWLKELEEALILAPNHISLYQLTIKRKTPFFRLVNTRKIEMPSDDNAALFYEHTYELTNAHNLRAYEVSNYATDGFQCQHNMCYWQYDDYLGIGPGAHGRYTLDGKKHTTYDEPNPTKWLQGIKSTCDMKRKSDKNEIINTSKKEIKIGHQACTDKILSAKAAYQEQLMMGLRLYSGISSKLIDNNNPKVQQNINTLIEHGFLEMNDDGKKLKATVKGMLILDSIIERLV
jgi:putative oxygen-independent coproporphyrinogen III oxidase